MDGQAVIEPASPVVEKPQKPPPQSPARRIRMERWTRISCLPMMLLGCVAGLGIALLIAIGDASTSVAVASLRDVLADFTLISTVFLFGLQIAAVWIIGVQAARYASYSVSGEDVLFKTRLQVARQRMRMPLLSLLLVRTVLLMLLLMAVILTLNFPSIARGTFFNDFRAVLSGWRIAPLLMLVFFMLLLLHGFLGPVLRLEYSMAIAAFGATFTRYRAERPSLAATARLGSGLILGLTFLWGLTIGATLVLVAIDPFSNDSLIQGIFPAQLLRFRDFEWSSLGMTTRALYVVTGLTILLPLYMAGQVILTRVLYALTKRRLALRKHKPGF